MAQILRLILALALLSILAADLPAQERLFPFFELTDADLARLDLHDGSVEDWLEILGEPTLTGLDFKEGLGRSFDPADLDFRIWLAWHDATDRIYVALDRADDIYANSFGQESGGPFMSFNDSAVDIFIDGDSGGDPRLPFDGDFLARYARDSQWYIAIAETFDDSPNVQLANYHGAPGEHWYEQPPFAEGGGTRFGENPTISITEFYITPFDFFVWDNPTASRISDLYPGKLIEIKIAIPDHEGELADDGFYPRTSLFGLPGTDWRNGLLLGLDGEIPEVSAVESITWAHIKATFD